ncbi:hypothetical protein Pcinc_041467 [Petrolisthes cinctipes]|uniref:Uncharacterized protein n=1 Tax=Petrolisthes cinctipes TaxID=88211 RepID=A0AAE1BJG6_PETCI|nr:hypothetical protein Pcinc_041467 [Petrolisthes cinctipes]
MGRGVSRGVSGGIKGKPPVPPPPPPPSIPANFPMAPSLEPHFKGKLRQQYHASPSLHQRGTNSSPSRHAHICTPLTWYTVSSDPLTHLYIPVYIDVGLVACNKEV